jgi:hypothetical protein
VKEEVEKEERHEQRHPPRTVRFAADAHGAARVAATAQSQPRAHQPGEEMEIKEEKEYSDEGEEAEEEEVEAAEKEGRQREQHAQAPGASFQGRGEAGADAVAPASRQRVVYALGIAERGDLTQQSSAPFNIESDDEFDELDDEPLDVLKRRLNSARARLPPGSYTHTAVEAESNDDYEAEEEEEGQEVEEEGEEGEEEKEYEEQEGEGEDDVNASGGAAIGGVGDRRSSQVAGVYWNRSNKKWDAIHRVNGKQVYLGRHATQEGAAQAVHNYVKESRTASIQ